MPKEYILVSERREVCSKDIEYYRKYVFENQDTSIPIVKPTKEEELVMAHHQYIMFDSDKIKRLETKVEEFN